MALRRAGAAVAMVASVTFVATIVAIAVPRPARVEAASSFGPNVQIGTGFDGVADTEPSVRVARDGTVYVGAIRGVPSGTDLWRSSDHGQSFTFLGAPDSVVPPIAGPVSGSFCCAALGGGDTDFALDNNGVLAWSSLTIADVTVGRSTDGGTTVITQPLGSIIPGVDREWNESDGVNFYMSLVDVATGNIDVFASPAGAVGGLVYTLAGQLFANLPPSVKIGNLVADRRHPGVLYQVYARSVVGSDAGAKNQVWVARSADGGGSWVHSLVFTGPLSSEYGSTFPAIAIDGAGNLFVVATDTVHGVLLSTSTSQGATWSTPRNVSTNASTVFPWVAAGGNGGVVVTWFGAPSNTSTTSWNVFAAESANALALTPTFTNFTVSDHTVHVGTLCTRGLGCADGRGLGDFFQVAVDPDGFANVAWADDGFDTATSVWFARGGLALGTPN